jgi:MraZ protein
MEEWERQNALIRRNTNPYNKEQAQFLREFYRGTAEISLDSNGRLLIPKRLLEMVNISKDIVLSGQDSKIEIWSKERYDSNGLDEQKFASLAEKVLGSSQLKEE